MIANIIEDLACSGLLLRHRETPPHNLWGADSRTEKCADITFFTSLAGAEYRTRLAASGLAELENAFIC